MIDYYLIIPNINESNLIFDSFLLGTNNQMGVFYIDDGFKVLQRIINDNNKKLLSDIKIKTNKGKEYTITQFFNIIEQIQIKFPNAIYYK